MCTRYPLSGTKAFKPAIDTSVEDAIQFALVYDSDVQIQTPSNNDE